jgi:SH3 domain-containing YSC84-like protein 1
VLARSEAEMRQALSILAAMVFICSPLTISAADTKEKNRLENCGSVLEEIMNVPEGVPQNLIDKAECVIIIPSVLKGAFLVGGSYGRGAMSCRTGESFSGKWSAPTMIALEGGSVGFQVGGQATDFVILVMNARGATAVLNHKVKLGVGVAAAAGPKGRDAQADTDITLRAEMLTYSRSRGLFAGISLEGSTLRPDNRANEAVYGKKIEALDIVRKDAVPVPPTGQRLITLLNKYSPRNDSAPNSLKPL